ncbi:MAG: hypothetical protein AAGF24_05330 [Cyanobacteria bacterium P01_H01_bin.121]
MRHKRIDQVKPEDWARWGRHWVNSQYRIMGVSVDLSWATWPRVVVGLVVLFIGGAVLTNYIGSLTPPSTSASDRVVEPH